jgi:hypothetical protein
MWGGYQGSSLAHSPRVAEMGSLFRFLVDEEKVLQLVQSSNCNYWRLRQHPFLRTVDAQQESRGYTGITTLRTPCRLGALLFELAQQQMLRAIGFPQHHSTLEP